MLKSWSRTAQGGTGETGGGRDDRGDSRLKSCFLALFSDLKVHSHRGPCSECYIGRHYHEHEADDAHHGCEREGRRREREDLRANYPQSRSCHLRDSLVACMHDHSDPIEHKACVNNGDRSCLTTAMLVRREKAWEREIDRIFVLLLLGLGRTLRPFLVVQQRN